MIANRVFRIGTVLTLALASMIGITHPASGQSTKAKVAKEPVKAKAKAAERIDLNSATSAELRTLPGVGEVTARKIIDARPHKAVTDLAGAGVSASEIEKLKPLVEVKPLPAPVDVNSETVEKLETLPGIGPAMAREIVDARPHSGYESIAKLKGIGPEKLDALKGRLKFGEATAAKAKVEEKAAKVVAKKAAPGTKVNINTAGKNELDELIGIGEVKSQAILDYRKEHGKFEKIEDIMKVSGIKEATFAKIKDMITVN